MHIPSESGLEICGTKFYLVLVLPCRLIAIEMSSHDSNDRSVAVLSLLSNISNLGSADCQTSLFDFMLLVPGYLKTLFFRPNVLEH
jgi:hypothetical protein